MRCRIPSCKYYKLVEVKERLEKKGIPVVLEIVPGTYEYESVLFNNGKQMPVEFVDVIVSGSYDGSDYRFIAKIEHFEKGNVISKAALDESIPLDYYKAGSTCDHCKTNRIRKETFLVKDLRDGSFKQVGRSCLKEYTNLDIEVAADCLTLGDLLNDNEDMSSDSFFEEVMLSMRRDGFHDIDYIKQVIYHEVLTNGYDRENTEERVYKCLSENIKVDYSKQLDDITIYAGAISTSNDYILNASNNWLSNSSKHIKLLASFVSYYLKEQELLKQNSHTKHIGKIGEKIEVKVASCRTIFKTYGIQIGYNSYADDTYTYKILDEEGNCYIWVTTKQAPEEGQVLIATIKAHKEYKGEKQTYITRGKIKQGN